MEYGTSAHVPSSQPAQKSAHNGKQLGIVGTALGSAASGLEHVDAPGPVASVPVGGASGHSAPGFVTDTPGAALTPAAVKRKPLTQMHLDFGQVSPLSTQPDDCMHHGLASLMV